VSRLGKLLLVHESEAGNVIYFLFFFLVVSAGTAIGRGTADALFFKRFGIEYLPLMYIIQSLLLAMVSTLYAAFADRVPAESFFKALFGILAVLVAASWLAISRGGWPLIYPVYYLVYEVASELLLVHSALYMNQNMNTLQAKRLSPLVYAGAQTGTIAGGVLLAVLAPVIGTQNLVIVWCLLLVTGIVTLVLRHRRHGASVYYRAHARSRSLLKDCVMDIRQGVRYTVDSELLRAASFSLFFMVIAFYILSYSVNRVYTHTFESEAALASFFGGLTAVTSIIALVSQLFVTNRVIHRFGVRRVNLLFPLTTLASLFTLVFSFSLPSALIGSVNKDAVMPAFRNPVRAMFFNILPDYLQGRARAMSIAVVLPLALFVCGSLLWLMLQMEDTRFFLIPGVLAALSYIFFSRRMNRAYISTLLTTLKERLFLPSDRLYRELQGSSDDVLQEVLRGVRHQDSEVAVAFFRLLVDSFPERAVDIVLSRFETADNATIDRLLKMIASLDLSTCIKQLHALAQRGDDHLKATILHMLVDKGEASAITQALGLMDSRNPRLVGVAIHTALQDSGRPRVVETWLGLLEQRTEGRLAALELMPDIERLTGRDREAIEAAYRQAVSELSRNPSVDIRIRVFKGIDRWVGGFRVDLYGELAQALGSSDPELRVAGAGCLHVLDDQHRDALLIEALGDGHQRVREAALRSLEKSAVDYQGAVLHWLHESYGSPRAQLALLDSLQSLDVSDKLYESLALGKADDACKLHAALTLIDGTVCRNPGSSALALTRHTLHERLEQTIQLALLALEPLHEPGIIATIRAGFSSGDSRHAANACEALFNLDNRHVADQLRDILLQTLDHQHARNCAATFSTAEQVLEWCISHKDSWLQICAREALQSLRSTHVHA
jgi:hypothetical protein